MAYNTKQFLDYAGLAKFWGLISAKFVAGVSVDATKATFTDVDGKVLGTINGASTESAGLMTAADKVKLEAVSGNIEAAIDLKGVAFGGNVAKTGNVVVDGEGTTAAKHVNLDVRYNSGNKKIEVIDLNNSSAVLTSFDASAFIKDGMLADAEFGEFNGKQQIKLTFNTDAGKEDIFIDITSLVDIYTGTNGVNVSGKVISAAIKSGETYISADGGLHMTDAFKTAFNNKADAATTLAGYGITDAYTKTEMDAALGNKADAATTYNKTQVDNLVAPKADKTYVDDELAKKADAATTLAGYGITDAYTKEEVNTTVNGITGDITAINNKIGAVTEGKTVVGMIGDAQSAAQGYADTAATAAYDAMVAITEAEITAIVNGTQA